MRIILAINPGSTTTKIAIFHDERLFFEKKINHSSEEIARYKNIADQFGFRKDLILHELKEAGIDLNKVDAVIGRGGLLKPIKSGVYEINQKMVEDLKAGARGSHASNLGGLIAYDIYKSLPHAKSYIADPVVVDELQDVSRVAGHPEFERLSIFHALNQKAIGRVHAKSINQKYEELNLIIAHLGGGISVGAHEKGKVIDVNNALNGEGPFSPERSGTLPAGALVDLCFSGKYSRDEMHKMLTGKGGMVAYFNTNNVCEVIEKGKSGDNKAKLIYESMAYQVAKEIGCMGAVLKGLVDGILLTGGIAFNLEITDYIKKMVSFIAPVTIYPGEDELKALAMNAFMAIKGETDVKTYQ